MTRGKGKKVVKDQTLAYKTILLHYSQCFPQTKIKGGGGMVVSAAGCLAF